MSKMTPARLGGDALKWLLIAMAAVAAAGFAFTRDFEFGVAAHELVEAVGRVLIVTWILGRVWCSLYGSGAASREMEARGPYSIVRNPLHLFTMIGSAGVGAQSGSITVAAVFLAVGLLAIWLLVRNEERALLASLGKPYADYLASTPRFIPNLSQWQDSAEVQVRPQVLVRTFLSGLLLLLFIPLAEGLQYLQTTGQIPILADLP